MKPLRLPLRFWRYLPHLMGLVSLIFFGMALTDLASERNREIAAGRQQAAQLTGLIAEHTARALEAVDILLRELAGDLARTPEWPNWSATRGFEYLSRRHSRALPQLRDLILFDAQGDQRFISTQFPARLINVRDRPYFVSLEHGADFAMYGPYVGRNSDRYTYALARRLVGPGRQFAGAVFAALEPAYFQDFCRSVRPSEAFESLLINTQGRIVAACGPIDLSQRSPLVGTHYSAILGASPAALAGELIPESHAGKLIHVANVSGFPDLRVLTLVPESALLVHWQEHARTYALAALFCLTLLVASQLLMRGERRAAEREYRALEAAKAALEKELLEAETHWAAQKNGAERADLAKSRFLAAASHDLRQPLHALTLFAADLAHQISARHYAQLPELAERIQSSTRALSELLDALLDLSRLDVNGIAPQLRAHPLADSFARLEATFARSAAAKGLVLRFRNPGLHVHTDPALLDRLLTNLVANALQYTPAGGILVSARRRGTNVCIEVRDTGIGIAPEHQKAVFVEFYQVSNAAREAHRGLGLGLSIVERLARALGARVMLRSWPGRGSCFGLSLPGVSQPASAPDSHSPPHASTADLPCIGVVGRGEALDAAALLLQSWGYPVQRTPRAAQIVVCRSEDAMTLANEWPDKALIVLGRAEDEAHLPPQAHRLDLPLRPAHLGALLRRLARTGEATPRGQDLTDECRSDAP